MSRIVQCPTCKRNVEWSSQQKWRPFCSERCKLIDLGEWASESNRIPCEPANPWELASSEGQHHQDE